MTKSELENTEDILKNIIMQKVDTIELEEQILPQIEELTYSNKSYKVKCSILFIDIRESTQLSENLTDKSMLKIYKSFIRMATQCVRYSGGYTRQFLGDRIMGIFLDDVDKEGNIIKKSSNKAVNSAREMNTYIDYVLNNLISKNINEKYIKCGIGICTGKVLLAQVGMKGAEQDESKQNEKGDVWVGYITNQASKFADLTMSREIFIDENTFKELSDENSKNNDKYLWNEVKRYKGDKKYKGYITKNLYVSNLEELQLEKFEYKDSEIDRNKKENIEYKELLQSLEEVIGKYKIKEIEISKREEEINRREKQLKEKENNITYQINQKKYYLLWEIFNSVYIRDVKVKELGREYWLNLVDEIIQLGKCIGQTEETTRIDISTYILIVYYELEMYDEAYEHILLHLKKAKYFPLKGLDIIKKAKKRDKVIKALENIIVDIKNTNDKINLQEDIDKIKELNLWG